MEKEVKTSESDQHELRSSIDEAKKKLDLVPGANEEQKAFFEEFASKDEEWRAYMDKKILRKVDLRLLPCLIVMYRTR